MLVIVRNITMSNGVKFTVVSWFGNSLQLKQFLVTKTVTEPRISESDPILYLFSPILFNIDLFPFGTGLCTIFRYY